MTDEPEVPICRVCRSEGTAEEPLFYPCRCSGSIKYVHQICLEEWLAHSNKKFCELCGYEYAFSPLYDPNMPESIPKRLIVKQMLANVSMIMLQVIRTTVVLGMWGFMLPYVIYWITRVLIWFAQTVVYSLGSTDVFLNNFRNLDTANMTSIAATAKLRFKDYDSWRSWYIAFNKGTSVPPIASHTGVLNGANHVADVLYSGTRACLRLSFRILHSVLGVSVTKAQINDLAEVIVELAAKCFEGSVIVMLSLFIFFILFILRDWVVTNAPLEENFGEAAVEEHPDELVAAEAAAAAVEVDVNADDAMPNNDNNNIIVNDGDNAANIAVVGERPNVIAGPAVEPVILANPAILNNQVQVQGQPIFAEDPQLRQPLAQPGLDIPLLDDTTIDERPVHQYRSHSSDSQPFAIGQTTDDDRNADSNGGTNTDPESSDGSDDFQMLARRLINRAMTADETAGNAANGHIGDPSVQRSNTWSYADEVYEEQSDTEPDRSNIHSASMGDSVPVVEVYIEDDIDNAATESSSDISRLRPSASNNDQSSSGFAVGEACGTRSASISRSDAESIPPVFTSETSRGIPAHLDLDGQRQDGIGNKEDDAEQERRIELRLRQLQTQASQLIRESELFGVEDRRRMHEAFAAARHHIPRPNPETSNHAGNEASLGLSDILDKLERPANDTRITTRQQLHDQQEPQSQEEQEQWRELEQRERELDVQEQVMDLQEQQVERQNQEMGRLENELDMLEQILERQRMRREQELMNLELVRREEQNVPELLEEHHIQQQQVLEQPQQQQPEQQPALPVERNPQIPDIAADIPPIPDQNNVGVNGEGFDENFGDFEAADGVLEAMGLHGPFFNAVQYFMLLFMIVVAVLVVCAWIPLVLGHIVLTFSPLRNILYVIHLNLSAAYPVAKLVLFALAPPIWQLARPGLVYMVHAIDTLMTTSILPIMPSLEPIVLFNRNIASKAPALWRLLTSPEAQSVFEKPVHDILASLSSRLPRIGSALDIEQLSHNTATALANFFAGMASSDLGTTYIEDFTNSILVVDPAVDPNANTSLFQPVWTYISKCLHELSYIKQWDHSVWTRIAGLDTRIARLADYMREISRGLTFSDRLTLIVIGVLICVYLAWHTVQTTSPDMRHKAHYQFSRLILMMAKIVFFVVIEIVLFPMLCGYCLDISLTPVLPEANRSSHYWAILNNSLSLRAAYWLAGLIFMIHFARFIAYCRQVMRPGLLWFIRDPNDAEFHPMREALEDRPISQKSKISRSAVMYCGTMLACIGVPSIAAAKIAPKAFPLHVDMTVNLNDYPVSVLYAVLSLFILLKWGRPYVLLRFLLDHWWQFAARTTRLSEFTLNQHDVLDEGKWVIRRAPLIPVVLPRFWMPTHVIKKAYEEVSQDAADKARFSDAENAIPTLEFNTLLQNKIDAALAESHPWVEFVLDGQNVRVPALDTVAVVAGRQMLVPVDDFGRPIEDKFDYEAADYPELQNVDDNDDQDAVRDLPPPAPDNNLRDLRFKAAQHKVIHVPPSLHMRVCMFMILGWAAIASFATVTFVLSLKIGKLCISRMGDMPRNDLVVLAIGLLLLLIGCESVYQLGVYIGSMYDLHGNWTQRFSESKRQIWRTVVTAWKTLVTAFVFLGVLPALYGKVLEVYLVTIVQMYVDNASARYKFARNMIQFMGHHWLFSLLHIWTIMSLLRAFPNSRLARTIDRLFAGPPHTWQVWRAIVEIGLPVGGVALLCSSLPFGLSIIDLWQQDRLTTEHVLTLIMMKDIRLIAKNSILIILSAVSAGIVWQACIIYKRWSRLARDRMYLVGQQLQNLGDNDLEVDQEGDVVDDFHPDEADDHLVVGAE